MNVSNEIKKRIVANILETIYVISDKQYQHRVWIRGEGPEVDAFDDTVCDYFGQCDSIIANCKDFGITENQNKLLKNFRAAFQEFSDSNDYPELFIDTPEWTRITEMAKEVLKAFNYTKARN